MIKEKQFNFRRVPFRVPSGHVQQLNFKGFLQHVTLTDTELFSLISYLRFNRRKQFLYVLSWGIIKQLNDEHFLEYFIIETNKTYPYVRLIFT